VGSGSGSLALGESGPGVDSGFESGVTETSVEAGILRVRVSERQRDPKFIQNKVLSP
jgi:hypothetical protein